MHTDRVQTAEELMKAGIPVTLVVDSAIGYIMERVDFVLVGSEGVVENGGIINQVFNNLIISFHFFILVHLLFQLLCLCSC